MAGEPVDLDRLARCASATESPSCRSRLRGAWHRIDDFCWAPLATPHPRHRQAIMLQVDVKAIVIRPPTDDEARRMRDQREEHLRKLAEEHPGVPVIEAPAEVEPVHEMRLREHGGHRGLDICIGPAEAAAIQIGLDDQELPRPMTHDLVVSLLRALPDVSVTHVLLSKVEGGTFYAELHLRHGDETLAIDCRPSDGVAVAIRLSVPIYVDEDVFAAA